MYGTNINKKGKVVKNKKVKEGECILPFKYKRITHDKCKDFDGTGEICATSVSKFNTLQTYGYCVNNMKQTSKKKTLKKPKKLKKKLVLRQSEIPPSKKSLMKKAGLKTSPSSTSMKAYNQEFIDVLGKLYSIMLSQGEPFRARAYKKAQESIMTFKYDITDPNQLKGKPGIGETILKKLQEYVETGTLRVLEREKTNPVNIFTQVYGIGPKKAKELVQKHKITSIDQLRENQELLNDKQKIGLKYYEDILKRIPRDEIDQYKRELLKVFNEVKTPGSTMEIVGSYRRGAKDSGDIDIIIGNESGNSKIFNTFLDKLVERKIIIEVLSRGKVKSLVIGKLPGKTPRRLDFLFSPPDEYSFAVLYFTGSAVFNTVMRQRALQMGYSMNEHGLYKMIDKKKTNKVDILFKTEKDIFEFLKMEYKTPVERKDGNAVVILDKKVSPKDESVIGLTDKETNVVIEKTPIIEKPIKIKKSKKKLVLKEKPKTLKREKKITSKQHAKEFIKVGIDYFNDKDEEIMAKLLRDANDAYYNKKPFLDDSQYDIIKEYIEEHYPSNKVLQEIGAPIMKNKVKLPYFMGSMDKIKPDTKALYTWMGKYKGPYVLSTKLDGISGMYYTEGGVRKLYTRGNGTFGQDISHLIPYLNLPDKDGLAIRGEIIMSKEMFTSKYSKDWSNARNLVAGIVNSKTKDVEKFNDLTFLAYELISPMKHTQEQFTFLETLGMNVALNEVHKTVTNEFLSEILISWRDGYSYEIDGVIVKDDKITEPNTKGNPENAFAFKMVLSDQVVEAKVVDVLWTPSKDGYLKPRVRIEPVVIGGARIEYATAFNGSFVEENKIGVGAVIQLVRSGDVIPHILNVIHPSQEGKMPDMEYKWNDTHIDVVLLDTSTSEIVKEKNITGFFKGLNVDGLGSGNVKKIMKSGKDSVEDIIKMNVSDFLLVDGFKQKMADKVYNSIQTKVKEASLSKLMAVSNLFGRGMGERRIEALLSEYPDILVSKDSDDVKVKKVMSVPGFAKKTAQLFVSHIKEFIEFMEKIGYYDKMKVVDDDVDKKDKTHPLYGKTILLTGFRNKELERNIKAKGGKIGSSVSKKTFIVLVKDLDEDTGKAMKAKELGITMMLPDEFEKKYL